MTGANDIQAAINRSEANPNLNMRTPKLSTQTFKLPINTQISQTENRMVDTECTVEQEDQTIDFDQYEKYKKHKSQILRKQITNDSISQMENLPEEDMISPTEKLTQQLEQIRELRKSPSTYRASQNHIQKSQKSQRKLSILEDSRFQLWQNMKQSQRDQLLKNSSKTEE